MQFPVIIYGRAEHFVFGWMRNNEIFFGAEGIIYYGIKRKDFHSYFDIFTFRLFVKLILHIKNQGKLRQIPSFC